MSALAPTPPQRLTDAHSRPYFLWDEAMTLDEFREQRLASALGWSRERIDSVVEFQRSFVDRLLQHAHPE